MLSLRRCREILANNCSMSDSEIERVREQLYVLARIMLDNARGYMPQDGPRAYGPKIQSREQTAARRSRADNHSSAMLEVIPSEERYGIEERAAIMECEGNVCRTEAEKSALLEWVRKGRETGNGGRVN